MKDNSMESLVLAPNNNIRPEEKESKHTCLIIRITTED